MEPSNQTGPAPKTKQTAEFLNSKRGRTKPNAIEVPTLTLPKGGGAIQGIDEKFTVNAVNGTSVCSLPLPFSHARGAVPGLSLSYNSGSGNGLFGLGWQLGLSGIRRKTDKKLPQYFDAVDSDIFVFTEAEDLVPEFKKANDGSFVIDGSGNYVINEFDSPDLLFTIRCYRPRVEGLFSRIERWSAKNGGEQKWRVISRENETTLFGWSPESRIADPANASKIYEWLPEFMFDDKGNCCQYVYKPEDELGFNAGELCNKNRFSNGKITYTNKYPEKIFYGNVTPYKTFNDPFPAATDYLFETVFDYGTLNNTDAVDTINDWDYRSDSFSNYKAGFEIRTTRLCKRILFFHHFKGANEYDGLVKSLNFDYGNGGEDDFTFLKSITKFGYIKKADGTYSAKPMPAMEFIYQKHEWNTTIKTAGPDVLMNAPTGIDHAPYQFVDLFNEGLSGILTEQAGGWYYKANRGSQFVAGENTTKLVFEPAKLVSPKPSFSGLGAALHVMDLDADGGKQVVSYTGTDKGYFELDDDSEWQGLRPFTKLPVVDFRDPFTKMIDLNGDGRPELVVSENNAFTWYENNGREGFSAPQRTPVSFDEEKGPAIVFADQTQSIFLADMCGSGMTDIVRIRNGEVCYWPNIGYGKFGAKITLDNSPWFDSPEAFNPLWLRLADIDGSGTTDIVYLGKNKFSCWKNLSGNRFSDAAFEIDAFPEIHSQVNVSVVDLLGNGVACLVWSSTLSKDEGTPLKYIDLMSSKKPHIMIKYLNNVGKEVSVEYTPSTKFYIDDKIAGRPWVTKLHFPVQCVSKITIEDKITGHKFSTAYKYHHGYFDHPEREFRGFGMVEQTESETFDHWIKSGATNITDASLHQEPVITRQWFHTGAFVRNNKILDQFEEEYWYNEMVRQGFAVTHHEKLLEHALIVPAKGIPQSVVDSLSTEEIQQALRACKGMQLRTEVFAGDASKKTALTPYSVVAQNCTIELLQPKSRNQHAVFIVKERENITYNYERNTDDPRISHTLNIQLDEYAQVVELASVVYPRRIADAGLPLETQAAQANTAITYTFNQFTIDVIDKDINRLRLPAEVKTFHLKGVPKTGDYYSHKDFENILSNAKSNEVAYHELDTPVAPGKAQRRMIEHAKTLYYKNDLSGSLPLGVMEYHAIVFETYQKVYTPALLADVFGTKVDDAMMIAGKFTHCKDENGLDDADWWVRSGTMHYIENAETAATAQNRFFVPISYTEPFGAKTTIKYYSNYFLMVAETEDELLNKSSVLSFNFRSVTPRRIKDINDNITEALTDELGLVKAMAMLGKGNQADDVSGLTEETSAAEAAQVQSFFNPPTTAQGVTDSAALSNTATQLLQNATARFVYDLEVYKTSGKPVVAASILRETHARDEQGNTNAPSKIQISLEYSSGVGNVAMKKTQAEPGTAKKVQVLAGGTIAVSDVNTGTLLRWIANGKTILNNKGNAVKQYEPYFSINTRYEDYKELVETGVTPVLYYDAPGRLIRTEFPDGTLSAIEFSSWKQAISDANDMVLQSDWFLKRTDNTRPDFITDVKEQQAAARAALHAGTPGQLHFDTLGRPVLSVDHNKNITTNADEFYHTTIELDIEGNLRLVKDDRGNTVVQHKYDMLGVKVYQKSMDNGERFLLQNVVGNPMRTWDGRNHEFSFEYDILHRPTVKRVKGGDGPNPLDNVYEIAIYGEGLPGDKANNLRGKPVIIYDTAGKTETLKFDFKGNALNTVTKFTAKYKEAVDWSGANLDLKLDNTESFATAFEYDALNRITRQVAPDNPINSVYLPAYNEAGLLDNVQVTQNGNTTWFVRNIDYNEKAQRQTITYGNNVITAYTYDKESMRLTQLVTKRQNNDPLQDLHFTYDAIGNITHVEDKNIPDIFFNNQKIQGISDYTYDAIYRLVQANGREHAGQLDFGLEDNWSDLPFMKQYSGTNPMAWRLYSQKYSYDSVGNILQMQHAAGTGSWVRDYTYEAANNRLTTTSVGDGANTFNYNYAHHPQHGYITALPHLQVMNWNFKDELRAIASQHVVNGTPETTYYVYDGSGHRTRKITEQQAGPGVTDAPKKSQRIYVGGIEIYREYDNAGAKNLERLTYHVMDDKERIAMIEALNMEDGNAVNEILVRYQFGNHLGSACMEVDGSANAKVISYEEFHPFGTTSYQATDKGIKAAAKRYRYTGVERDEESGLEYHSARYYMPWLGRWLSADPIGIEDGVNLYRYVQNDPVNNRDVDGKQTVRVTEYQLQSLSPGDVQRLIVAGGGRPGLCYTNPTYEQRQADITILRDILRRNNMYDPSFLAPPPTAAEIERYNNEEICVADSHGMGYCGPRSSVEGQRSAANFQYQMQVGDNIRGGIFGTLGYMVDGERGSYVGAAADGLLMAAGSTAAARNNMRDVGASAQPSRPVAAEVRPLNPPRTAAPPAPPPAPPPVRAAPPAAPAAPAAVPVVPPRAPAAPPAAPVAPAAPAAPPPPPPRSPQTIAQARAFFNLPAQPTASNSTITGIMRFGNETLALRSGVDGGPWGGSQRGGVPRGQGYGFTSGGPSQGNISTHVEGHAAAIMWQRGLTSATVIVESDPCSICSRDISSALPPGATLTVISPGHGTTVFRSTHAR